MPEPTFETRLAALLEADSQVGVRPVDRYVMARTIVEAGRTPRSHGAIAPRRWLVAAFVVLLLGAIAAGSLIVAGRPWESTPAVPLVLTVRPTGSMVDDRSGHSATRLADGRVLVTGGWNGSSGSGPGFDRMNASAELYDPSSASFAATGSMGSKRQYHTSTLLKDGHVLVVGGLDAAGNALATAELYDPATGSFGPTGALATGRFDHAAVPLPDGRVAVIGGNTDPSVGADSPATPDVEIYDPLIGLFSAGPSDPLLHRIGPRAEPLPDGSILVLGGEDGLSPGDRSVAEMAVVWDPVDDTVAKVGLETGGPFLHDDPVSPHVRGVTELPDGRVLVAILDDTTSQSGLYAFDPATIRFTLVAAIPNGDLPVLDPATLDDGRVLVTLGSSSPCDTLEATVLDLGRGSLTPIDAVPGIGSCNGFPGTTVTVLADGSVLLAGGNSAGGETTRAASLVQQEDTHP